MARPRLQKRQPPRAFQLKCQMMWPSRAFRAHALSEDETYSTPLTASMDPQIFAGSDPESSPLPSQAMINGRDPFGPAITRVDHASFSSPTLDRSISASWL